ncbi:tol-pal system-associated acyl-CoA thioesterase [Rhodoferax koreense]|uniref:Tol-pal system-associated acyl-CoA thioesterase n=1 Tax=Rhodoferax koreensis TaxID=1842727 RepID=A0A1P8K458_9BURK|nr:tol-pal system-associated acyl-CoA thioesterase [Rhodoferax koreense]APW40800.1 tol-pal system-associated acyl-CoA thioesterase [Rhodoferax koreense]
MGFAFPIRVYWEDTDAGGIVFYANYLKFMERARTEWLRALGIGQRTLKADTGCMFVVTDTSLRYLQPARLDDELLVTARLEQSGRASLTIGQQVLAGTDRADIASSTVLCEGRIRISWVNAETLKPARIPPTLLEALK